MSSWLQLFPPERSPANSWWRIEVESLFTASGMDKWNRKSKEISTVIKAERQKNEGTNDKMCHFRKVGRLLAKTELKCVGSYNAPLLPSSFLHHPAINNSFKCFPFSFLSQSGERNNTELQQKFLLPPFVRWVAVFKNTVYGNEWWSGWVTSGRAKKRKTEGVRRKSRNRNRVLSSEIFEHGDVYSRNPERREQMAFRIFSKRSSTRRRCVHIYYLSGRLNCNEERSSPKRSGWIWDR